MSDDLLRRAKEWTDYIAQRIEWDRASDTDIEGREIMLALVERLQTASAAPSGTSPSE